MHEPWANLTSGRQWPRCSTFAPKSHPSSQKVLTLRANYHIILGMIDDEDHGNVRADPCFQVAALDRSRKGLFGVLPDVACSRLRLHFNDAAGRFKSLSIS